MTDSLVTADTSRRPNKDIVKQQVGVISFQSYFCALEFIDYVKKHCTKHFDGAFQL